MSRKAATKHTRTTEWTDPSIYAEYLPKLTGREFFEAILSGKLPHSPISQTIGYVPESAGDGKTVFSLEPGEHLLNPLGVIHGGILGTLLDSAMTTAIQTSLPKGKGFTTLEYKVNFIRPVTIETGKIIAAGECLSLGKRTATARADVKDNKGKLLAHGTSTCMIFDIGKKSK